MVLPNGKGSEERSERSSSIDYKALAAQVR